MDKEQFCEAGTTFTYNSIDPIVAAGAVVTKDVPDNTIVAGVPTKIVRRINTTDYE